MYLRMKSSGLKIESVISFMFGFHFITTEINIDESKAHSIFFCFRAARRKSQVQAVHRRILRKEWFPARQIPTPIINSQSTQFPGCGSTSRNKGKEKPPFATLSFRVRRAKHYCTLCTSSGTRFLFRGNKKKKANVHAAKNGRQKKRNSLVSREAAFRESRRSDNRSCVFTLKCPIDNREVGVVVL